MTSPSRPLLRLKWVMSPTLDTPEMASSAALNAACGDLAGFVYGIYLTVQCWSKLSGGIDNTVNTTRDMLRFLHGS